MLGTILLNVYGIRPGLDVGTELDFLDGSFDGSNGKRFDILLLGGTVGFADGEVLGYD